MTEQEYLQIIHDTAEAAERIQTQRDELLAALKNAHRDLERWADGWGNVQLTETEQRARVAIARIETNQE